MRHRAVYNNLTFDEVPKHFPELGKPLNAVNLVDELLTTVSAAVDQQPSSSSNSSCSSSILSNNAVPLFGNYNHSSNKTADEVWREICGSNASFGAPTLEEFLFRAGAMHLGSHESSDSNVNIDQQQQQQQNVDWWQYQQDQKQQIPMFVNSMVGNCSGFGENNNNNNQLGMQGVTLPILKHAMSAPQIGSFDAKQSDECIDKNFQRKQKRMIKNRESAARSRARKQAYITQLEEEVTKLTDKNKRLKKQKENEMKSRSCDMLKPKYQLRRTSSALF